VRIAFFADPGGRSWIVPGLIALGHEVAVVDTVAAFHEHAARGLDGGFVRTNAGREGMTAARDAQAGGMTLWNAPEVFDRCRDKRISQALFERAGLAVPPLFDRDPGPAWEGRLIAKPIKGSKGEGVTVADRWEGLPVDRWRLLVQGMIEPARLWRIICTPDRVLGGYRAVSDESVINLSRGATADANASISPALARIACSMCAAVGADATGADILEGQDGRLWALEANARFGLRGFDGRQMGAAVAVTILQRIAGAARGPDRSPGQTHPLVSCP